MAMSAPALAAQIQGQGTISADNLNTFTQTAQIHRNYVNLRDFQECWFFFKELLFQ